MLSDKHKQDAHNKTWTDIIRRVSCYFYKGLESAVIHPSQLDFHSHAALTIDCDYKLSILSGFILPRMYFAHVYLSRKHKEK